MRKLGEAANRLSRLHVLSPDGVEWALAVANQNFIIHQYDQINRELTWLTLSVDLPTWQKSLTPLDERLGPRSTQTPADCLGSETDALPRPGSAPTAPAVSPVTGQPVQPQPGRWCARRPWTRAGLQNS